MTLTDRHLDALKHELRLRIPADKARYAALLASDVEALTARAAAAMRTNDVPAILAIGEMLIDQGALGLRPLRRIGFFGTLIGVLIAEGRYETALQVLGEPRVVDDGLGKVWLSRAQALAGSALVMEARAAAERALELDPGLERARELVGWVDDYRRLKAAFQGGSGGWPELGRLVDICLDLGLPGYAARFLFEHLAALPPPAPDATAGAVETLCTALPLLGPEAVLREAGRIAPVAAGERLKALMIRCLTELGQPSAAVGPDAGGRDVRLQRALALAEAGDLDAAISRLGRLTEQLRKDLEVRAALMYCAGAQVLAATPLQLRPAGGPRQVFNLMPFNDELALLRMHLAEMIDWVDLFVIVESEVTFTGQPKPLYFERHKHEFAAYAGKIRHVVLGEHPPAFHSPWGRDFRQRDMAITAISGLCAPDDLVLLTDVDEIVDRRALDGFEGDYAGLRMAMFRFFLNYRPDAAHMPVRRTGAVWKARHLARFGSSYARFGLSRRKDGGAIDNAGWHFTSMCDPARLVAKMNSYAHQERKLEWRDLDTVDRRLAQIRSGRLERGWERAEIDETLPAYIRDHRDELRDLLI